MRTCTICGCKMHKGFLHEVEGSTYCGTTCMSRVITPEEYNELNQAGICFWTSWELEDI